MREKQLRNTLVRIAWHGVFLLMIVSLGQQVWYATERNIMLINRTSFTNHVPSFTDHLRITPLGLIPFTIPSIINVLAKVEAVHSSRDKY